MALTLTDDQRQRVEAGRKATRPSYFNADNAADTVISEDFEAVMILLPSSSKMEIQQKMKSLTDPTKRDDVLKAALADEITAAEAVAAEAQEEYDKFTSFQKQFTDNPEFQKVGESAKLIRDAQLGSEELIVARERARHRSIVAKLQQERLELKGLTPDLSKEVKSWTRVITTYSP
jgi:hypothetical protein